MFGKRKKDPPHPNHVPGIKKGEEAVIRKGREPGRGTTAGSYRDARDSTTINADLRQPIHGDMPNIPPA